MFWQSGLRCRRRRSDLPLDSRGRDAEAVAVNVAVDPAVTVTFAGGVMTWGALSASATVSVAGVVVCEPEPLVNTASYS